MLSGCGGQGPAGDEQIRDANSSNVHRLTNLYASFAEQNRGFGPEDEEQFRLFISQMGDDRLDRMGVNPADLDGLFVSERDDQPFTIRYRRERPDSRAAGQRGGDQRSLSSNEVAIVLEAVGVDGIRQVGFLGTRAVKEMSEEEIKSLQ